MAIALPRLGSFSSENNGATGFAFSCFSCSVFRKGLLRGNGTGTGAVAFATAAQFSATKTGSTTVRLLLMPFALTADRYTSGTITPHAI
jgi:hypothetical protein